MDGTGLSDGNYFHLFHLAAHEGGRLPVSASADAVLNNVKHV